MWLVFTLIFGLTMAIANYIDEYLTHSNTVSDTANIHKRIGGVFLISMLFGVFSVVVLGLMIRDLGMTPRGLYISIFSSIPMVTVWASYFYLFQKFPAHQVVPLFGLSSFWLLMMEVTAGASITLLPLCGIFMLLIGAYLLDTQSFTWKIPTKLLICMIPVTFVWAGSLFLVKIVSQSDSVLNMFFYQYLGIVVIGILSFLCIKQYREGLIARIKSQGKSFLGGSIAAEGIAQISFMSSFVAVSLALLATYVSAVSSVQYIFLFLLFFFFPLHERNKITPIQVFSMCLMVMGIFFIEFFK